MAEIVNAVFVPDVRMIDKPVCEPELIPNGWYLEPKGKFNSRVMAYMALECCRKHARLDTVIIPPDSADFVGGIHDAWNLAVWVMDDEQWEISKREYIEEHGYLPGTATSFAIGIGFRDVAAEAVYVLGAF